MGGMVFENGDQISALQLIADGEVGQAGNAEPHSAILINGSIVLSTARRGGSKFFQFWSGQGPSCPLVA